MPGFLIPLAGLALGALGNLIRNRRAQQALGNATITANASTPAETGLSTAATSSNAGYDPQQLGLESSTRIAQGRNSQANPVQTGSTPEQEDNSVSTTQPATGPVQQNQGVDSPTPPAGQDAGLAARLGRESVAASRRKNREQQVGVSNAALR